MKKVLLTGADSPIGKAVVKRLLAQKENRIISVTGPTSPEQDLQHRRVKIISADLTRERSIQDLFHDKATNGITHVIHLAMHRDNQTEGWRTHQLNVEATRSMIDHCDELKVEHFIYRSWAEVYETHSYLPTIVTENHPVDLATSRSQWFKDRVEADQILCSRMGMIHTKVKVLRMADCLWPGCGSQLYSFLQSELCITPLGFDPMFNLITPSDLANAIGLAMDFSGNGVFDIPGKDNLPLSEIVFRSGKGRLPLPEPVALLVGKLRCKINPRAFRYHDNAKGFRYGSVLAGDLAKKQLGYRPEEHIDWNALQKELAR